MSEPQLAITESSAQLSDTLVDDFDLVEFLHSVTVHAQRALGVEAVGLLLADNHGGRNVVAASGERARGARAVPVSARRGMRRDPAAADVVVR
ncbi:hypothetical protein [Mycobacterium servetii]|uniref:Uncharacterized protein n=1 Tax=Mycobacterium servetii TaxID=3237418 RepID=A0ABV4C345_9MYCO